MLHVIIMYKFVTSICFSTVYGLYRDGTELRGVYYAKPYVAHAACVSMGDTCDYPILLGICCFIASPLYVLTACLGNDPLYGGESSYSTVRDLT